MRFTDLRPTSVYDTYWEFAVILIEISPKLFSRYSHVSTLLKIAKAKSLKELYEILLSYPTLGSFLAFQFAIDIDYSDPSFCLDCNVIIYAPFWRIKIIYCFQVTINILLFYSLSNIRFFLGFPVRN